LRSIYVTGANSGLGYAVARQFLSEGDHVILACRDSQKAEKARNTLIGQTGKETVGISILDLASLNQVCQSVKDISTSVDILVCNAGVSNTSGIRYTSDGFEESFGVNHLGHFLLTNLMLKKFDNTLKYILVVSSNLHNPTTGADMFPAPAFSSIEDLAHPDKTDAQPAEKKGRLAYVNSKLCNVLFTYKLDELLKESGRKDISINAFNPGFMPQTNLGRDTSPGMRFMLKHIMPHMKLIIKEIRTAEQSATDLFKLVKEIQVSGKYFDGLNEIASSPLSYDRELSSRLWDASIQWTGLRQEETIFKIS